MALNQRLQDIRLIAFDLDGTLVADTVFIWTTLHEHFGSDPVLRKQASSDFFAGRITYAQWFETDLKLLSERGATREGFLSALEKLSEIAGASETLLTLCSRGYKLAVISGSIDLVVERFFGHIPFAHVLINRIHFDAQGRPCSGVPTDYDLDGKADGLCEIARREGLAVAQCAFVGDNVNDLSIMRKAGVSFGFNIKSPEVVKAVDVVIEKPDLRELLPYFPGFSRKI